ncbi:hypothetical protein GCM10009609_29230 [Pseudonocardia aurantiaca]|uniref:Uncharacterized protein n=1 Tax=Pseudonocardia aurantiaca TaxID=75290 RepID=A0ABW4FK69_9PSEU
MLTVLLHVTPGATGPRCELRQFVAGTWRTLAGHDLPDAPPDRTALAGGPAAAGEHLTGLLLRDDTRRAWEELRDASPYGMRTLVQVDPPDLQVLNWEWMALARTAFPDRIHPVVRARGLDRDDVRLELPLRVLAVVGDLAELPAAERGIERAIAAARGRVDAEVLITPTADALQAVHGRMRPHVLHAVGCDTRLLGALRAPAPRLVVLDRGPDPETERHLTGTLLDARACAVLTVPAGTDGATGAAFAAELYAALAAEEPVDVAVAHALEAVEGAEHVSGVAPLTFNVSKATPLTSDPGFLPSLTVRVPPEQVLRFDRIPRQHVPVHDGPAPADRAEQLVELARALTRFDRLREAGAELDGLLAAPHSGQGPELRLLQAGVALRCGRLARAVASVRGATDGHRVTVVRVRAALAGPEPGDAMRIATTGADAATPQGLELAGATAAELMLLDEADRFVDAAADAWLDRGVAEGAVRCHARAAVLGMRERGRTSDAAEHLDEAARLEVPVGSSAWVRRAAAHLELLHRQGRPADAGRAVAAMFDALRESPGVPPRRLVRAAVDALAVCRPDQRAELLGLVVAKLRRVTPPAARVVLLAGLRRVPALPAGPLPELHDLVRDADHDPGLAPGDRALLTLTLAELDRLSDRRAEAEAALAFVRGALPSPLARRAWWATLDRLGPPVSRTAPRHDELAAVAAATGDLPLLAAAFLVERAEAQRDADATLARRLVQDAVSRLAEAPEQDTQWHSRLRKLAHELAQPLT